MARILFAEKNAQFISGAFSFTFSFNRTFEKNVHKLARDILEMPLFIISASCLKRRAFLVRECRYERNVSGDAALNRQKMDEVD